jgi:hypothetical protein
MSFGDRIRREFAETHVLSADATKVLGRADGAEIITGVDVFNASNLATHATNYVTFKLINMGTDANGTTVIAAASTSQTGGSGMTANVAFPLSVVAAAKQVADGDAIGLIYDESTTDVANSHEIRIVVRRQAVGPSAQ